jgi:4-hydroxybenzoate polyprenyltransferase
LFEESDQKGEIMQWTVFHRLVKTHYTLFALPYTLAGAILPFAMHQKIIEVHWQNELKVWIWIICAFVAARTAGMAFNELIDRHIDALNPRTQARVLPQGDARPSQVVWIAWLSLGAFVFCCAQINGMVLACTPLICGLIVAYSYTKRITALSHFVLGLIHFFGPLMAWAAIVGSFHWAPVCLGGALWMSIAGSDILYAIQDVAFDRQHHLHSLPVLLSPKHSVWVVRLAHAVAFLLLVAVGALAELNSVYYIGVLVIGGVFVYYHRTIDVGRLERIPKAFFSINAVISITIFLTMIGTVLWRALW